jgi:hypothetical protein
VTEPQGLPAQVDQETGRDRCCFRSQTNQRSADANCSQVEEAPDRDESTRGMLGWEQDLEQPTGTRAEEQRAQWPRQGVQVVLKLSKLTIFLRWIG